MTTTNAQRQAAYRARHLKAEDGGGERLNVVIDLQAKRALERLATCYGVTQRAILERLAAEAERLALDRAATLPNGAAEFYEGRLRLNADSLLRSNEKEAPETAKKRARIEKSKEEQAGLRLVNGGKA